MWTRLKSWLFIPGILAVLSAIVRYTLSFKWDSVSNALLLAGVLVLLCSLILNWKEAKRFYKKRSTVYFTFSLVSTIIMLGILFLANFIVFLHPKKIDLTKNQFFTLSEQTVKIVGTLDRNINVLAFYKENEQDPQLQYLARQYRALNHRFSFQFVDPDRDPTTTQKYGVSKYKTVIMELGEKRLRVEDPTESGLTNTLLKITQESQKPVYFLTGHGEHNYDSIEREGNSHAKKALEETNYDVRLLNLSQENKVPDDCVVLILSGARQDPTPAEMDKIQSYLNRGGSLLLLLDPKPGVGFEPFLLQYGIKVGDDVVIDASGAGRVIGAGPEVPFIRNYAKTEITSKFYLPTFYPRARSLSPAEKIPPGVQVLPMMQTSRSSWGETELGPGGGGARYDEGKDIPGPITLAAEIIKPVAGGEGSSSGKASTRNTRIVVFGDSDFATNLHFNVQGNGDLFINSANWLAGQSNIIAIRPKKPENKRLALTAQSNTVVFYICVLLMPAVPLAAGIWILLKRFK